MDRRSVAARIDRQELRSAQPVRELRDLTRYRRKLAAAGATERNRLLKLLETANIKLAGVASKVFGVSGRS
jgi:transposase